MCIKNKEAAWVVFWDKVKKTLNFLESEGGIYLASDDEASLIGTCMVLALRTQQRKRTQHSLMGTE